MCSLFFVFFGIFFLTLHNIQLTPCSSYFSEHQATPPSVYWHYFHFTIILTPLGLIATAFLDKSDAKLFLVVYTLIGGYFSGKMIRLVLLISPAAGD